MHRIDNSKYLLYIEPPLSAKSDKPVDDILTEIMVYALANSIEGASHYSDINDMGGKFITNVMYRGVHRTECGKASSNCDYMLQNGMITNSLAPYYLRWYRDYIPDSEINKVKELVKFYQK